MPQRHDALLIQALPDTTVSVSSDFLFGSKPNAALQARLEAGARHERTL
jgi:hypothetical protein